MKCQVLIVSILKVDVAHHQPVVCRLQFEGIIIWQHNHCHCFLEPEMTILLCSLFIKKKLGLIKTYQFALLDFYCLIYADSLLQFAALFLDVFTFLHKNCKMLLLF